MNRDGVDDGNWISLTLEQPTPLAALIAGTPREPCECCGTPLAKLTIEFPGETIRMLVELSKIVDATGERGNLQPHTPDRCHAQRYRDGKTDLALQGARHKATD